MYYKLFYASIDSKGSWLRDWSHDINALINLALDEQDRYDSCYIEQDLLSGAKTVWEPSLGYIGKNQPA